MPPRRHTEPARGGRVGPPISGRSETRLLWARGRYERLQPEGSAPRSRHLGQSPELRQRIAAKPVACGANALEDELSRVALDGPRARSLACLMLFHGLNTL